jgi:hypothetical protein
VLCAPVEFPYTSKSHHDQRNFVDNQGSKWVLSQGRSTMTCCGENCPAKGRLNKQIGSENQIVGMHVTVGHASTCKKQAVDGKRILFNKITSPLSRIEESLMKIENEEEERILRESLVLGNSREQGARTSMLS